MKIAMLTVVFWFTACGGEQPFEPAPDAGPPRSTDADAGIEADAGMVGGCARVSSRVGWTATLSTRFHGVRGVVTMTDACTLTLSGFSYDGQGIDVRLYGASTGQGFAQGIGVGPQLFRPAQPWVDETLVVSLPPTVALEALDRISVWCVAAGVDFGSGSFMP